MNRKLIALLCALLVPAPALSAPARPAPARSVWHVVEPGQSMAAVARRHGLSVAEVARWNQIVAPYPVHVDEVLRLTRPAAPLPAWRTRVERVTIDMVNWRPGRGCPLPMSQLRRIWVSYIDFQGRYHDGSIVVHKSLVTRTQRAFQTLFRWRFRIQAMAPMGLNMPGWTDATMMTSGYSCRRATGSANWSEHAYGRAIDVNPIQNPMIRGSFLEPPGSRLWVNRDRYLIGMIHGSGAARAFTANGFRWGGRWRTLKDWMHFSPTNR